VDLRRRRALRAGRAGAAHGLPLRRHVRRDERRHAARAHERHPRTAAHHALGKADLVLGYALAFGLLAVVQGAVVTAVSVWLLGLDTAATSAWLVLVVVASGVLGTSLGLLASAFAATEFQAVQLMPATVLPQFLLCGLLVPRDRLPRALELVSDVLPLSYVVDAATSVARQPDPGGDLVTPLLVIAGWIVVALALGSLTLRRRTG
jgi:ABC-2 type transport system permease protein